MKPEANEYAPYYGRYIDLVLEEEMVGAAERQESETAALLAGIGEEKGAYRYAPDKWSIKEVVGHVTDAERVFAYRVMAIARGEQQPLPGFDEKEWMRYAGFDARPFADVVEDLTATRRATLALLRSLPADAWTRTGTASGNPVSARAVAYTLLGHERHHVRVLRERYLG